LVLALREVGILSLLIELSQIFGFLFSKFSELNCNAEKIVGLDLFFQNLTIEDLNSFLGRFIIINEFGGLIEQTLHLGLAVEVHLIAVDILTASVECGFTHLAL
jgi:hypothetical protein